MKSAGVRISVWAGASGKREELKMSANTGELKFDFQNESIGRRLSIPLDELDNNPYQARTQRDPVNAAALRESIRVHGQIQPIQVRATADRWQIIVGHGRVEALRALRAEATNDLDQQRFNTVRAEERLNVSDEDMLILGLIENLKREDISPVDSAAALVTLQSLRQELATTEAVSKAVGLTLEQVRRLFRLHAAPEVIKQAVAEGMEVAADASTETKQTRRLEVTSALELAKLYSHWQEQAAGSGSDPHSPDERMTLLIARILREEWTSRKVQSFVSAALKGENGAPSSEETAPAFKQSSKQLVIFYDRLTELDPEERANLKAALEPIWSQVAGARQRRGSTRQFLADCLIFMRAFPARVKRLPSDLSQFMQAWRELRSAVERNVKMLPPGEVPKEKPPAALPPGRASFYS
jgi:ParB/RepB/Spo0J family partition protein